MIRSAAIFFALLVLTAPAHAQEPAAPAGTHIVQSGETLASIARQHLGSATEWETIYEANRSRLADPSLIRPGMELVIPGRGSAASGPATVSGVQFDGQAAVQVAVETLPYEDRRAMLLGQPFTPGAPPELDLASRTIFFPPPDSGPIAPVVITQRPEEIPAVPEGVFRAAGWIVPLSEGTAHLGEITGLASPGTTPTTSVSLIPGAEVVLRFFGEGVPRVGEEFVTYSLGHEIPGYGRVAVPTGLLSVVRVDGSVAVAKVVGGLSRMRVGH
jgi:LysM repeat protein